MLSKKIVSSFSLLVAFLLFHNVVLAQGIITGKVTDGNNKGLPSVTISAKGTSTSVLTDTAGNFSIAVPAGVQSLTVTSAGFSEQEIPINGKTYVDIVLQQNAQSLNDVVVIGYGTARRKDVTGTVSVITSKDFTPGVVSNPMQQIQGKVAGLVITQPGGDPNQNVIIRLRGQTSLTGGQTPLIVLDGVPLDDPNQISSVPPGDIASYDVLKDVSATAIYGARGANGVIIVNTRRGVQGKTVVEYNGYAAMDKLAGTFNLLNSEQWRQGSAEAGVDPATIAGLDHGANTDWLKAITRTAYTNSQHVAVSGGHNGFNYRASVNYMNQQGIVINSGKEQFGVRFVAQQKALNDKLTINVSLASTQNNRKYVDYNMFDYVNTTPPTYPVYNPDGTYFQYTGYDQQNPVARQMLQTNKGTDYWTFLYAKADYEFLPGLSAGVLGSISNFTTQSEFFQPTLPGVGNINNGSQTNADLDSKKGDIHINYNKSFGNHHLNFTGVYEYNDFIQSNFSASGQNFLVENLGADYLGGGNPALNVINSYKAEYELISFLGRLNYNYNEKYYATVTFRRDGSSKFGVNNRWANFPSVSVAWNMKSESFLSNTEWLSELRIKAGYGVVGNQEAITPYNTLLTLAGGTRYFDPTNASYSYPQSYSPNQNANPDLKWESRYGLNLGVDFAFAHNRFGGSINAFSDKTKNLLFNYSVPVPPFFVPTILANVGELTNKGLEIQLSANIIQKKDFTWAVLGQITFVQTRITSLQGSYNGTQIASDLVPVGYALGRGYEGNAITYLKAGYTPGVFYLPQFAGLSDTIANSSNSNQEYYTADGSKTPNIADAKKNFVDPTPDFTYGITNNFTYKQIGLSFFLRGVYGQKLFNNFDNVASNISRLAGNNITKSGLSNGIRGSQTPSSYWLQNASYLRLDNVTISYNFKVKGLQTLRAYISGSNLFVLTPYKGMDPEINNGADNQAYIDANVYGTAFYPRSRSFVFGVNLAFN